MLELIQINFLKDKLWFTMNSIAYFIMRRIINISGFFYYHLVTVYAVVCKGHILFKAVSGKLFYLTKVKFRENWSIIILMNIYFFLQEMLKILIGFINFSEYSC